MKTAKTEWLIWLQFSVLFLLLFLEVSASGKSCEELLRNITLPAHTEIARKHGKVNHVTFLCEKGYYFSDGKNTKNVSCTILTNDQIPQCTDFKMSRLVNKTAKEGLLNSLQCSGTDASCSKPRRRARALNLKYKGGLDLIFMLETSSSIARHNFILMKETLKTLVQIFGIDSRSNGDGTHIACVSYGTHAKVEFKFNDYSVQTKSKALKRIDRIRYARGMTATQLAFDMVREKILPSSKRPDSVKALFVLTDGGYVGNDVRIAANKLKKSVEIYVIAVGIGKKVWRKPVARLASKTQNVFSLRSFKNLKKLKRKIAIQPTKDYSECGRSPFKPFDARARIVGGEKANERDWPWAVKISVKGSYWGVGALINQEFVLTAANFFDLRTSTIRPNEVKVFFQDKRRTAYTSLALYIHPDYNKRDYRNDIALIKIPKLQRFSRNQQAICLPRELNITNIIKHGNNMYAVGWGRTKAWNPNDRIVFADTSKNPLKQVKLPFKTSKFCDDHVKNKKAQALQRDKDTWYFNSTTQFCAGDVTGQNDTCQGDGGGPAMVLSINPVNGQWRWFQVGIVSWGYGCAQKGEVGYYTKVSAYFDWIDKIIKT